MKRTFSDVCGNSQRGRTGEKVLAFELVNNLFFFVSEIRGLEPRTLHTSGDLSAIEQNLQSTEQFSAKRT